MYKKNKGKIELVIKPLSDPILVQLTRNVTAPGLKESTFLCQHQLKYVKLVTGGSKVCFSDPWFIISRMENRLVVNNQPTAGSNIWKTFSRLWWHFKNTNISVHGQNLQNVNETEKTKNKKKPCVGPWVWWSGPGGQRCPPLSVWAGPGGRTGHSRRHTPSAVWSTVPANVG